MILRNPYDQMASDQPLLQSIWQLKKSKIIMAEANAIAIKPQSSQYLQIKG